MLFQGDSITDGGRMRNKNDPNHIFGQDYAYLIAADSGGRHPSEGWSFINRGISGNKVTDLEKRWDADAIQLVPDMLSIMIGINDVSSAIKGGTDAVSPELYEARYDGLLQRTLAALPRVKLILAEPFALPVGHVKAQLAEYDARLPQYQAAVARLADRYHAPLVRYQAAFDAAVAKAPADYWIWDGIHPTYAGHRLMADEWLQTVNASF